MKICIVTGSNGLVGSSAVEFFLKKKFKVIGIDNNLREYFFGKDGSTSWVKKINLKKNNFEHKNIDIRNYKKIENIYKNNKNKIKLIIHAAAQPSHDWAAKEPLTDFTVNANGTLNLLECARIYSPKAKFVFTSTNKVYGDNPNRLKIYEKKTRWELKKNDENFKGIKENFSIDNSIHSFFGVSKTYADLIVQEYGKNLGLKTVCFRGGCITGPNHSGANLHGFLSFLVKQSLKNKKYDLIGYKGKQVRDNLHSIDLINCFWEFFKKPRKGEIYNIGGGRKNSCSIIEVMEKIHSKTKIKFNYSKSTKNRVGDHIWYISNNKKFQKHYKHWKIKYNLDRILDEIILSFKLNV